MTDVREDERHTALLKIHCLPICRCSLLVGCCLLLLFERAGGQGAEHLKGGLVQKSPARTAAVSVRHVAKQRSGTGNAVEREAAV